MDFSLWENMMGAGGYTQDPGSAASDYQSMDPSGFTGMTGANLYGGFGQDMVNKGMGAMNAWGAQSDDPNSFMSQYLNDFSGLQGAVTDATSPLNEQLQRQMQQNIKTGMSQAGGQMSGLGALRSSAMGEAAGGVVGRAATDASAKLANAQLGMLGQMGGQAMGQRGSAMGQMMGMPGQMLGMQSQFGQPNYVAPTYTAQPSAWDRVLQVGGLIGDIGGAIPGF
jgi:hypothetical protein